MTVIAGVKQCRNGDAYVFQLLALCDATRDGDARRQVGTGLQTRDQSKRVKC
jgi:hypothetical protein